MNSLFIRIMTFFCTIFSMNNICAVKQKTVIHQELSEKKLVSYLKKNCPALLADLDPSYFNNGAHMGLTEVGLLIGVCSLIACGVVAWCCCPNQTSGTGILYQYNTFTPNQQSDTENPINN